MSHPFSLPTPGCFAAGIMLFTSLWSLRSGEQAFAEVEYAPYMRDYGL